MPHLGPVGEPHHLLDQRLAAVVGGMRLARHDQLDRLLLVEQQLLQPIRIAQHQRQPLVGRHPPREPDGQHVRIESRCDPAQFGVGCTALQPGPAQPGPDVVDQQLAQLRANPPQVTRVDLLQPLPRARAPTAGALGRSPPESSRPSSSHCGAAQVGACTPLVIEPIGTSDGSKPGHSSLNISRLTRPCSSDTPLARCASRRPMWAMLNFDGSSSAPNAMIRSSGTPGSSREVAPDGLPSAAAEVALHHLHREPVDAGGHRGVRGEHRATSAPRSARCRNPARRR